MKTSIMTVVVAALLGTAFAGKAPTFNVRVQDAGFTYYSNADRSEIDRHHLERTSYLRLWVTEEGLSVQLADAPFEGAIAHTFTDVPELDRKTDLRIWGARRNGGSWLDQQAMQADEVERVHRLAGIDEQGLGWAIYHGDADLTEVVATYLAWFASDGLTVEAVPTGRSTRAFVVSNDSLSLRVTFANLGDSIRVYFQE